MKENEIRAKATTYLNLEENSVFRNEVKNILDTGDMGELTERFWRELDFGTGGLRGIIGGGYNRINTYTIRKTTQGLANYIISYGAEDVQGVVIAYDSRHFSDIFAEEAAQVMAANGIKAWLFTSLRPTPVLSYAVRQLGACAGIMITASHNPAEYNGYKVYWLDGAQIVSPHDKGIITEVHKVTGKVAVMERKEAEEVGLIIPIGPKIDDAYRNMVVKQSLNPELVETHGSDLKIVYSPLHGAGTVPIEGVLDDLGMTVVTVPEQREPDGDFPTLEFPNPEIAPALKMALDLATKEKADLVMATDPDADRLGVAIPDGDDWSLLSGNRLGALLADYIFRTRKEQGRLPAHPAFVNTIVTSELQNRIADFYGVTNFRVLTGFKYIGEKIRQFEANGLHSYIFGGEESYGYLVGTSVRDKDAVSAASMTAELALWNRQRGMSLFNHLEELWKRFGYYDEILIGRDFEGQQGLEVMDSLMESLRRTPPVSIASIRIDTMRDFKNGTTWNSDRGESMKNILLPSSNVLQCVLEDSSLVTVRPSGTEPKIKFYASCRSEKGNNLPAARAELGQKFDGITEWVNALITSVKG